MNTRGFLTMLAGLSLLNAGCGGDNLTLPSEGQPARIEILSGDGLERPVSTQLPPLVVRVTDSQNRPVPGAIVQFALVENGGGGTIDPSSDTTDANGQASTTITLGTEVGTLTGQAQVQVEGDETPPSVGFTAKATSTAAAGISIKSGDGQSAPVGAPLPQPLVVQVSDEFGNPIPNVTVQWTAEGGGTVSSPSTTTGENGQTSVQRTLGPNAGQQTTIASADGVPGLPVTFTHIAISGSPSRIEIVSGNEQSAPTGTQLPQELVVRVLDQNGNPVVGQPVSWVVGTGGGSANPETSPTDGEGLARTSWTLGGSPGTNTLNAVVSGIGNVTFTATATGTGSPSVLAITTQPPASVTIGATLNPAPVVQTRDAGGHDVAVAGVEITVALSGPGQLEGTRTVTTDANGRAQFSDLRITGTTDSPRLIFAADGYRSVTSTKIDVDKASTTTSITGVSPPTANEGDPVTVSFSVTSALGTPSGEVEVTATGASGASGSCRVPVSVGSCVITFDQSGIQTITATYRGSDVFAESSDTESYQVNEPVPPPNSPPVASFTHADCTAGVPCQFTDTSTDPDGNSTITEWTWNFGDGTEVSHEQSPVHIFEFGSPILPYAVQLTVKDNQGATSTTTQFVLVQ